MKDTRFIHYDRRRLPRRKHTIPRDWTETQDGKFFRCWNCGFTCNIDVNKLGDGVGYRVYDDILTVDLDLFSGNTMACTLSISTNNDISLIEADSTGGPKIFHREFKTTVTSGCPFCGTRAFK